MPVERVGTQLEDGEKELSTLVAKGRFSEGRESRCQPVTSNYQIPGLLVSSPWSQSSRGPTMGIQGIACSLAEGRHFKGTSHPHLHRGGDRLEVPSGSFWTLKWTQNVVLVSPTSRQESLLSLNSLMHLIFKFNPFKITKPNKQRLRRPACKPIVCGHGCASVMR